jgi:hypothetical protein
MTSRTLSHYSDRQAVEICSCITLDDLLARGNNAQNPLFKNLSGFIHNAKAHDCGAHLLEWPDGSLVLVISASPGEFAMLSADVVAGAYRHAVNNCGLIYRAEKENVDD